MSLDISTKPTGWFHIGWSGEIPPKGVKPMKYFGHDLVAFRSEAGELAVLDAHCHHMGAHLGYGGKVKGDCIACPYHGWQWNTAGENALIPYQDQPIRKKLRKWHVVEKHELIFLWHDPAGGAPREGWEVPDIFAFEGFEGAQANAEDFYSCYPHAVVDKPDEPIHPQLIQENAADCMHFRYTHGAPEDPEMLWFKTDGPYWRSSIGFKSPKTKQVALRTLQYNFGVGLAFAIFDGRNPYRLVLAATPIDDKLTYMRVSYWFPRQPGATAEMPEDLRAFARHTEELYEEDARIWRHQKFVQRPIFARQDVAAYTALRNWCSQFYEAPAEQGVIPLVEDTAATL